MSETLEISSKLKEYEVSFIHNTAKVLKASANENTFFIADEKVMSLYKGQLFSFLPKQRAFIVQATENKKTLEFCYKLIKLLIGQNIRKNSCLVAIGGGIIQDITAFISSILFRGINWYFFPTTLLAQADSCIGGKTSINIGTYKNLLGNFYPPSKIFIDTKFLGSLPKDALRSGIGEMLHFYFIAGSRFADKVAANYDQLFSDPLALKEYIIASLKIKKAVIERDEFDKNERNLFNYGHTFGHALETVSNYKLSHGQAVTIGMDIANYVSLNMGYLSKCDYGEMHHILVKNMPQYDLGKIDLEKYLAALARDKKNKGHNLGCILTNGPGAMKRAQLPFDAKLRALLSSYFKQ